ncbi:pantetheine-phosphate adenylyltransferase [candidate division GN15 bacterium]|uniref:Phosphopantetheine adenylyltransferase n=1 Tax=candidate division GN15 bacterium TaxID=2072418 RepID=A0A855X954_9BACT|nr:MAG: pantetheine-phosphate adenylyltransferase [candidate division GN15 bacterium]
MPEARIRTRAIYPGTFDPTTNGHLSLVERASYLFDEVLVAISRTPGKPVLFTYEERFEFMNTAVKHLPNRRKIKVVGFDGLLADFVKDVKATAIIRGLRAVSDFEYEFQMALMNRKLAREAETVFLMPALSWVYLSASIIREVARNKGDVNGMVPPIVKKALERKFRK